MSINNKPNVAKIKVLAKEQGITQKFLCDCLGKRRSFLTEVAAGKDKLDPDELEIIADKLNTTVEYLTDQTEQKEKPTVQTDDEQIPELAALLNFMAQMHPAAKKQLLDFAAWLVEKDKQDGSV